MKRKGLVFLTCCLFFSCILSICLFAFVGAGSDIASLGVRQSCSFVPSVDRVGVSGEGRCSPLRWDAVSRLLWLDTSPTFTKNLPDSVWSFYAGNLVICRIVPSKCQKNNSKRGLTLRSLQVGRRRERVWFTSCGNISVSVTQIILLASSHARARWGWEKSADPLRMSQGNATGHHQHANGPFSSNPDPKGILQPTHNWSNTQSGELKAVFAGRLCAAAHFGSLFLNTLKCLLIESEFI